MSAKEPVPVPLDYARWGLTKILSDCINAGGPIEDVVKAIEHFVDAKLVNYLRITPTNADSASEGRT